MSDFGLSTGFHKQHDSAYYQRLLEGTSATNPAQSGRNSVAVNSITLTLSNKDAIATWKANRRKLVSSPNWLSLPFVHLTPDRFRSDNPSPLPFLRPTLQLELRITSLLRSSSNKVMEMNAIGGLLELSCSSVFVDTLLSALRTLMTLTGRF